MKANVSAALLAVLLCIIAPVPIFSFTSAPTILSSNRLPQRENSRFLRHLNNGCCQLGRAAARSLSMTSQAVDLPTGLGINPSPRSSLSVSASPVKKKADVDGVTPAYDRTQLGPHVSFGSQVFNLYGAVFAAQAWLSAIVMFPLVPATSLIAQFFDRRRMRLPTLVALVWGRLVMLSMGCRPRVQGAELLPPPEEAVVFVANHGSYLDIPVTNFLPRLCKYLMKAELLWLPIVGWKAVLARDIFVHRQSSATFRRLLESTNRALKAGNSIMTFPEGTRSKDGRLGEFKRGPFTMAKQAGVQVVPVTITGVAKAMPPFALAPLRKPRNVRLQIHPPISTKGRDVKEVMAEARRAVCSGLEDWQQPSDLLPPPPGGNPEETVEVDPEKNPADTQAGQ